MFLSQNATLLFVKKFRICVDGGNIGDTPRPKATNPGSPQTILNAAGN
jgi:hypothetical protein